MLSRSQGVRYEEEAKETLGLMLEGGSTRRTVPRAGTSPSGAGP